MGSSSHRNNYHSLKNTISLKSHAKVNIGLRVLAQRSDGYHNIQTVFQELGFHDTITLTRIDSGYEFSSNVDWLKNDESNLCIQAWSVFSKKVSPSTGVAIRLEKNIPAGGGLGGGSSNAASILIGLNQLFEAKLSNIELMELGKILGADVPFFIEGGTQLGEGIGEKLRAFLYPVSGTYLLIIPNLSIETAWAYAQIKKHLEEQKVSHNFAHLFQGDESPLEFFENDFELVVIPTYPEIGRIKAAILGRGAKYVSLSGSGSTVYGIFDEEANALKAESDMPSEYLTILTSPKNRLL